MGVLFQLLDDVSGVLFQLFDVIAQKKKVKGKRLSNQILVLLIFTIWHRKKSFRYLALNLDAPVAPWWLSPDAPGTWEWVTLIEHGRGLQENERLSFCNI